MTTGYKVISLLKSILILILGALPMLLLGISLATKGFFAMVVIAIVVYAYIHFSMERKKERKAKAASDRCPYKVEVNQ